MLVGGLYGCAVTLGGCRWLALRFDPISLVLAQRNGVEPPKKSAFFYLGGSTIRVSAPASVVVTHLRPTWGGAWWVSGDWCGCADTLGGGRWLVLRFDPISLVLAQRNGVEPPKKSAFEASTSSWWAHPPLPFGRKPQRDKLVRQVDLYSVG